MVLLRKRIEYAEFHDSVLEKVFIGKSTLFGLHFCCMEWIDKVDLVYMEGY